MSELEKRRLARDGESLEHFKMNSVKVDGIASERFSHDDSIFHVTPNWMFDFKDEDVDREADSENSEGYLDDTYYDVWWSGEHSVVFNSQDDILNEDAWLHGGYIEFF